MLHRPKLRYVGMAVGLLLGVLFSQAGCDTCGPNCIKDETLASGGVFVAYVNGCEGCEALERGDLIRAVDGRPVQTGAELDASNYADGEMHTLSVIKYRDGAVRDLSVRATPLEMPPIASAPPLWTTDAERLHQSPSWARRRLFGHAMPAVMLYASNGGMVTGRDLYGKKRFMVLFDWQTREEQAIAQTYLQVLQKATHDLEAVGYDVMLVQLKFPGRDRPPMNDTDLRDFVSQAQVRPSDGGPLPLPRTYRYPNAMEYSSANDVGLEGSTTLVESLGASPAILIVDERGIVLWHSEGAQDDPSGKLPAGVYSAVSAVMLALNTR